MTDISIDDMIAAQFEARPGFKKGGQPIRPFWNKERLEAKGADPMDAAVGAAESKRKALEFDADVDKAEQDLLEQERAETPDVPGMPSADVQFEALAARGPEDGPDNEAEMKLESIISPEVLEAYKAKTLPKELQDAIQSLYDNYAIVKSASAEFAKRQ